MKKIIFTLAAGCLFLIGLSAIGLCKENSEKNVILIGWDGVQYEHVMDLLDDGSLPNLEYLVEKGSIAEIRITSGKINSKPGWTEILTGYNSEKIGIISNKKYGPIPRGYTIFERLKDYFEGNEFTAIFLAASTNHLSFKGEHELCRNCFGKNAQTIDGKQMEWVKRKGAPFYFVKEALDVYKINLEIADNVGNEAIRAIRLSAKDRFFAFFHFDDPDEMGHNYGENSKEYETAIIAVDVWLGKIIKELNELGVYNNTVIYVTSAFGMDEGRKEHRKAKNMIIATNSSRKLKNGNRKDVAVTLYDEFGVDIHQYFPAFDGKTLFQ